MINPELDELEFAPPAVVRQAGRDFAAALAESQQFINLVSCIERLKTDQAAQKAIVDFNAKQKSLQMLRQLNAISTEDQAELERLQRVLESEPAVTAYLQAQSDLAEICQAAADLISHATGLNYAAACGGGCCG